MILGLLDQLHIFLKFGLTPCNAEQPLQGIKFQEKKAQKIKNTWNLSRKNL